MGVKPRRIDPPDTERPEGMPTAGRTRRGGRFSWPRSLALTIGYSFLLWVLIVLAVWQIFF